MARQKLLGRAGLLLAACSILPINAYAQEGPVGKIENLLDKNGINYSMDSVVPVPSIKDVTISIGSKDSGEIEFSRTLISTNRGWDWVNSFNYRVDSIPDLLPDGSPGESRMTVTGGVTRDEFSLDSSHVSRLKTGGRLEEFTSSYVYTSRDGTVINFQKVPVNGTGDDYFTYGGLTVGVPVDITYANGEKLSFNYYAISVSGAVSRRRINSVSSNHGYQIRFEYAANNRSASGGYTNNREWHRLVKVYALNSAIDYCNPSALSCSGLTQSWPQATFTQAPGATLVETSIDSAGTIRTYNFTGDQYLDGWSREVFSSSSRGSPATTVASFGNVNLTTSVETADGATFYAALDYDWSDTASRYREVTYQRTDPLSGVRLMLMRPYSGKPVSITDEINRVWRFQYDLNDRLIYMIEPEGTVSGANPPTAGYTKNIYDIRGNITEVIKVPKVGSSLETINIYAGFPESCTYAKTCNKPIWTVDAKGNQTDYAYDNSHGGVLSELKPAAALGSPGSSVIARPLTLTVWQQRYGWAKNASGTLVQSSDPIWKVSTVTDCQAAPGSNSPICDSSKPQTVKTYEYGASGTRETLLVKGVAVTSGGVTLRTCYGYDIFGRRISETKPLGTSSSCP